MAKKRILYVSQEINPYLEDSDIARASLALPKKMNERGHEIRVFMPRFGVINERRHQLHEVIRLSGINIIINDMDQPLIIKVASVPAARLQVYFIDNDEYFKRKAIFFDDRGQFFTDNDERALFFCRGVVETVRKLGWAPDIIHCHGWMTSLLPLYLKRFYADDPLFTDTKVVTSLYNFDYCDRFSDNLLKSLAFDGIAQGDIDHLAQGDVGCMNRLGVLYSDAVLRHGKLPVELEQWVDDNHPDSLLVTDLKEQMPAIEELYASVGERALAL